MMDDKINSKFLYDVIYINIGFGTVDLHLSVQYANCLAQLFCLK